MTTKFISITGAVFLTSFIGAIVWFMADIWFNECSYDPDGHSPCLIAHVIFDNPKR